MVFADASDEFYEAVGDSIGAGGAARAEGARDGSPGAPSSCTGVAPPATSPVAKVLPLHYAAFHDDAVAAREAWGHLSWADRVAQDPRGNTALHVAALRGARRCAAALLELGLSVELPSRRGFTALQDAAARVDEQMVRMMVENRHGGAKAEFERQRPRILKTLVEAPDFRMSLKWELRSFLFGGLLRKYTPHDVYDISKVGCKLRIDGTLMGLDEEAATSGAMLPRWRRGRFSLILLGGSEPRLYLLRHPKDPPKGKGEKKKAKDGEAGDDEDNEPLAIDMLAGEAMGKGGGEGGGKGGAGGEARRQQDFGARRETAREEQINMEVSMLLAEGGASRSKFSLGDVNFGPSKSWLFGAAVREKVYGWATQVFDLHFTASTQETTRTYRTDEAHADCTFEDYVNGTGRVAKEETEEGAKRTPPAGAGDEELDIEGAGTDTALGRLALSEMKSIETEEENLGDGSQRKTTKKRIKGRCWMAQDFPLQVDQLMPLLQVVQHVNKQIGRLVNFFQKWDDKGLSGLFPVRLLLPIMFTVAAHLSFKRWKRLDGGEADLPEGWFDVSPAGYRKTTLPEMMERSQRRAERASAQGGGAHLGPYGDGPFGGSVFEPRATTPAAMGRSDSSAAGDETLGNPDELERLALEAEQKGNVDTAALDRYLQEEEDNSEMSD